MKRLAVPLLLSLAVAFRCAAVEPNGLVVLLTDYGPDSVYVGVLKGAVYSKHAGVRIETLTNSVPAFDIVTGAYLLAEGCQAFPKGTVFCCVVDPGVGTARKPIALETRTGQVFVGPDNGLLSLVAGQFGCIEVRECANRALWRADTASNTFQGRDVFGPVAAALAHGVPLKDVGPELDTIVKLDLAPSRVEDGAAHGTVIRIDEYGNVITNVTTKDCAVLGIAEGDPLEVTIGDAQYTAPFVKTYGSVPAGERLVLVQSSGLVELAANMKNLAEMINAKPRAAVTIKKVAPAP